eukprot:gene12244-16410_t
MPIIGDYTWNQKKDQVKLLVPLKGVSIAKVDIFVTTNTLKVNFAPYILDLILFDEVDALRHKATVKEGVLNITLFKKNDQKWDSLLAEIDSKEKATEIKKQSLNQYEQLNKEVDEKKIDKKVVEERHAVRKQMALEENERTRIENLKQEEKLEAEQAVYETFAKMTQPSNDSSKQNIINSKNSKMGSAAVVSAPKNDHTAPDDKIDFDRIFDEDDIENDDDKSNNKYSDHNHEVIPPVEDSTDDDIHFIPPPRSMNYTDKTNDSKININFTPRVFPTPMRESKASEEEDWIAKNRRHLKKHGVLKNGLGGTGDVSEEDPVWLKAKGDDFFRNGDMNSAINAYSAAIEMDEHMIPCYSNRSACFLKIGLMNECKADCTIIINQLLSEIETISNEVNSGNGTSMKSKREKLVMSVKLLMRRGLASCQLGSFNEALNDYFDAKAKYEILNDGNNNNTDIFINGVTIDSLSQDIHQLKLLNNAEMLKKEADCDFSERSIQNAMIKYDEALQLVPVHVGCLANRSACKMALGDLPGCVDDCSSAIHMLEHGVNKNNNKQILSNNIDPANMLNTILPPPGSEKRRTWLIKTLTRRGVAYSQLEMLDEAVTDYAYASSLDPSNEALKSDLNKISNFRQAKKSSIMSQ